MRALFDLIVFSATGFTGRLVAEYRHATECVDSPGQWAMEGHHLDKLAGVRGLARPGCDSAACDALVGSWIGLFFMAADRAG